VKTFGDIADTHELRPTYMGWRIEDLQRWWVVTALDSKGGRYNQTEAGYWTQDWSDDMLVFRYRDGQRWLREHSNLRGAFLRRLSDSRISRPRRAVTGPG
jgi:hypothetical protein